MNQQLLKVKELNPNGVVNYANTTLLSIPMKKKKKLITA